MGKPIVCGDCTPDSYQPKTESNPFGALEASSSSDTDDEPCAAEGEASQESAEPAASQLAPDGADDWESIQMQGDEHAAAGEWSLSIKCYDEALATVPSQLAGGLWERRAKCNIEVCRPRMSTE